MNVTWNAAIPPHWNIQRLRWFIQVLEQGWSPEAEDRVPEDGEWCVLKLNAVSRGKFDRTAVKVLPPGLAAPQNLQIQPGDLLITRANTPAMVADVCYVGETCSRLILSDLIYRLRLDEKRLDGRYLSYFLLSLPGRQQVESDARGTSGSMVKISQEHIRNWWAPLPPLAQQRAIATYLDQETVQLDKLVVAKEHVLELLEEKRRALITHAVTRGLDLGTPLRDSGIPWLGEIPAHWEGTRLKFVAKVRGGLTLGKNYGGVAILREYPYLRVANVQDGHLDLSDVTTVMVPESEAESCLLEPGDILMNEGGDADKLGRGCIWKGEIAPCLHQNHVFAVRPKTVQSEWLNAWTSGEVAKAFFESRAKQSTNLASISASNIKELPIPIPPRAEQGAIVARIREQTVKLDAVYAAIMRSIALLKERRAALIAAAVTGKIDVGGDHVDAC